MAILTAHSGRIHRAFRTAIAMATSTASPSAWAWTTPRPGKNLAGGKLIDQNGKVSSEVNFIFNSNVRSEANDYLARADTDLDFSTFWAIRVTSGGTAS